jgi:hypothetical protein
MKHITSCLAMLAALVSVAPAFAADFYLQPSSGNPWNGSGAPTRNVMEQSYAFTPSSAVRLT